MPLIHSVGGGIRFSENDRELDLYLACDQYPLLSGTPSLLNYQTTHYGIFRETREIIYAGIEMELARDAGK